VFTVVFQKTTFGDPQNKKDPVIALTGSFYVFNTNTSGRVKELKRKYPKGRLRNKFFSHW